ncbi:pyridoxamine kinase [Ruminococcus sp.]|uniref:pyridoxamine kinase n=1 Tax=Ruminococcus sp. TaxID=41978 RepID=UPI00262E0BDE|nr:pyridoxamine kinase [Ruminococcus sp.]MDD6988970.1 pyridoxamine kinase [Ruminococcus sp.]MDY6201534.1 pyridoxamine kinase [Ruminococcus sp.]
MIKKAAVINDLSGFGKCSLTATIAVLSVMGVQPCPMPTAVLTNQTGYKNHYCIDLTDELCHYKEMWSLNNESFDGIYSGYIADKRQVDIIFDFINTFRKSNTVVLVDPVMGDNGRLYSAYNDDTCKKVCGLARSADIITPNLTELCILTNTDFDELNSHCESDDFLDRISEVAKSAIAHSGQKIVVTGINKGDYLYNGVFSKQDCNFVKAECHGGSFSGTGDIFASIVFASVVNGENLVSSVKKAVSFIEKATADTAKEPYDRNDGINFEKFLYQLHN